jgi:hypothetical protein
MGAKEDLIDYVKERGELPMRNDPMYSVWVKYGSPTKETYDSKFCKIIEKLLRGKK